jgi:adenine-specific DNA-methyltransferase
MVAQNQGMRQENKSWKYTSVFKSRGEEEFVCTIQDGSGNDIRVYRHHNYERSTINALLQSEVSLGIEDLEKKLYKENLENIFSDTNAQSSIRARVMDTLGDEDGLFSIEYIPLSGRSKGKKTTIYYVGKQKRQIIWLSDIAQIMGDQVILKGKLSTLWDNLNWNNVAKEGGISFPNGKKPIAFIQRMLNLSTKGEDGEIILDFFTGSGSTAHAVLDLNARDNGDRRFIVIQLPERAKGITQFSTIADLCKQRIRNSIDESEPMFRAQMGFVTYCLSYSNFKEWQPYRGRETEQLEGLFDRFETPFIEGWQPENLLTEILLLQGFPLDSRIRSIPEFSHNQIHEMTSDFIQHRLYVCLDKTILPNTVSSIHLRPEDVFVCLDSALSDEAKIMLADRCNLKVI